MSEEEQEQLYANLLVEERRTQKKLAALAAKCKDLNLHIRVLLDTLAQPTHCNLPLTKERYSEFWAKYSTTNIPGLFKEIIETYEHLESIRRDIKGMENGIDNI